MNAGTPFIVAGALGITAGVVLAIHMVRSSRRSGGRDSHEDIVVMALGCLAATVVSALIYWVAGSHS